MTASNLKSRINELCTDITFKLNGKSCGIDPITHSHFDMWYGDKNYTANSIDEVMDIKFFDGKSLSEIADSLMLIDY